MLNSAIYSRSTQTALLVLTLTAGLSAQVAQKERYAFPPKTGVLTPGIQRSIAEIHPDTIFPVEGHPDWLAVTQNAVWVSSSNVNHVVHLNAITGKPDVIIDVQKPCSGLVAAFGSVWIPSCDAHTLLRATAVSGKLQAAVPIGPADSEGGITAGAGSIWLVTSKESNLARVDATTNAVIANIPIPAGSFNPVFADGSVWIASNDGNVLVQVDAASNKLVKTIPIGPKPRFLTVGVGSIWTLNQGDGTISRVEIATGKLLATIQAGIPGEGGEIAFGSGSIWATLFKFPITRVDVVSNQVTQQWTGPGGDSIRVADGYVWLSNLAQGNVWRFKVPKL